MWDEYFAIQLTPDQKAAARAEVERDVARAASEGVYERALEIAGQVQWSAWWYELRNEE